MRLVLESAVLYAGVKLLLKLGVIDAAELREFGVFMLLSSLLFVGFKLLKAWHDRLERERPWTELLSRVEKTSARVANTRAKNLHL